MERDSNEEKDGDGDDACVPWFDRFADPADDDDDDPVTAESEIA